MNIRDRSRSVQDISEEVVIHRVLAEICSTVYHQEWSVYELIVRWQDSPIPESVYLHEQIIFQGLNFTESLKVEDDQIEPTCIETQLDTGSATKNEGINSGAIMIEETVEERQTLPRTRANLQLWNIISRGLSIEQKNEKDEQENDE